MSTYLIGDLRSNLPFIIWPIILLLIAGALFVVIIMNILRLYLHLYHQQEQKHNPETIIVLQARSPTSKDKGFIKRLIRVSKEAKPNKRPKRSGTTTNSTNVSHEHPSKNTSSLMKLEKSSEEEKAECEDSRLNAPVVEHTEILSYGKMGLHTSDDATIVNNTLSTADEHKKSKKSSKKPNELDLTQESKTKKASVFTNEKPQTTTTVDAYAVTTNNDPATTTHNDPAMTTHNDPATTTLNTNEVANIHDTPEQSAI